MAAISRQTNRNLRRRHPRVTENDDNAVLGPRGQRLFACPFFKHQWKEHQYCVVPMRHVSDVRQHIRRAHQGEISEDTFSRIFQDSRTGPPPERWYSLWNILFPGETEPESPYYVGSPSVELAICFINDFKRQENLRPDEHETLEKLATFVTSTEMASQGSSTPLRLGSPDVGLSSAASLLQPHSLSGNPLQEAQYVTSTAYDLTPGSSQIGIAWSPDDAGIGGSWWSDIGASSSLQGIPATQESAMSEENGPVQSKESAEGYIASEMFPPAENASMFLGEQSDWSSGIEGFTH